MCHYYYLLCWSELQRFQFISTCFEEASLTPTLIQKQKHSPSPWQDLKAKGPNKTGLVSKKKKKDWPTEKQWIVSDRPTTFQDSVGLSQNKIAYLITCHESLIRFSHPIPKHLKIHNFHLVYWYTFELTTNFILLLFIYY